MGSTLLKRASDYPEREDSTGKGKLGKDYVSSVACILGENRYLGKTFSRQLSSPSPVCSALSWWRLAAGDGGHSEGCGHMQTEMAGGLAGTERLSGAA